MREILAQPINLHHPQGQCRNAKTTWLARTRMNEGFDMRSPVGQRWARELKSTPELREQYANGTERADQARFRIAWAKAGCLCVGVYVVCVLCVCVVCVSCVWVWVVVRLVTRKKPAVLMFRTPPCVH